MIYQECKEKVMSRLEQGSYLSFTSDIWTAKNSNEPFISLTAHWIDKCTFEPTNFVLAATHFPGSHTGQRIAEIILKSLEDWKVNVDRRHIILTDTTANIVRGALDTGMNHAGCFLHKLQLAIHDSINSQRVVIDTIAICRNIATHFHHSAVSNSKLQEMQTQLGQKKKKIIQDVSTRWNSTYYMLLSIFEQKRVLSVISGDIGIRVPDLNQWKILESLLCLLKPFEEITKIVSRDSSLISDVIPHVATLKRYLEKENQLHAGVGTMKSELLERINVRFNEIWQNSNYTLATLLDPRYKSNFFTAVQREIALEAITREANLITACHNPDLLQTNPAVAETNISNEQQPQPNYLLSEINESFWQCYSELSTEKDVQLGSHAEVSTEISLYMSMQVINRNDDPMQWWKSNRQTFRNLALLTLKYASAPASTVCSERLFSETGNIYEAKRNRLLPEHGEQLAFVHHNWNRLL